MQFMAEAGYDPRAALDLWDLMAAVEADSVSRGQPLSLSDRLSLLQTHPTSQVRQDVSLIFASIRVFGYELKYHL